MPSKAYSVFHKNILQVDKLLAAYTVVRTPTRGRKHLDHLTRSAIIFLCSSWEVYLEQISRETCAKILARTSYPNTLPRESKKALAKLVADSKNEIEAIEFASDWKSYFSRLIDGYVSRLNTPKSEQVKSILHNYFGADNAEIVSKMPTLLSIDSIVKMRGEIAHNIYVEEYVAPDVVQSHKETVIRLVKEIELFLWEYIPSITNGKRPWQNTYR